MNRYKLIQLLMGALLTAISTQACATDYHRSKTVSVPVPGDTVAVLAISPRNEITVTDTRGRALNECLLCGAFGSAEACKKAASEQKIEICKAAFSAEGIRDVKTISAIKRGQNSCILFSYVLAGYLRYWEICF